MFSVQIHIVGFQPEKDANKEVVKPDKSNKKSTPAKTYSCKYNGHSLQMKPIVLSYICIRLNEEGSPHQIKGYYYLR